jgi:hypothetical protein
MRYIPFLVRVAIVLTASVFIAKCLGVLFSSVFTHVLWLVLSAVVYIVTAGMHLALESYMRKRRDKQ